MSLLGAQSRGMAAQMLAKTHGDNVNDDIYRDNLNWADDTVTGAGLGATFGGYFGLQGAGVGAAIGGGLGALSGMAKAYGARRGRGRSRWDAFKSTVGDWGHFSNPKTTTAAMRVAPMAAMSLARAQMVANQRAPGGLPPPAPPGAPGPGLPPPAMPQVGGPVVSYGAPQPPAYPPDPRFSSGMRYAGDEYSIPYDVPIPGHLSRRGG